MSVFGGEVGFKYRQGGRKKQPKRYRFTPAGSQMQSNAPGLGGGDPRFEPPLTAKRYKASLIVLLALYSLLSS